MKLRALTIIISFIIHMAILFILIVIPPMEDKKNIRIEPIMVYVPKSPLAGTPPLFIPREEKKVEEKGKKENSEAKIKNDIPITVKEKKEIKNNEKIGEKNEGKGENLEGKIEGQSIDIEPKISSEAKEDVQDSGKGIIYSEGLGRGRFNYPSGFYFRGGGGKGGEGIQGFAGSAYFESGGYDITPWAKLVIEKVKRNWFVPIAAKFGIKGITGIYLVFERDGNVSAMSFFRKSGVVSFDQSAENAIISSIPFPELPYDFPKENLPAYFFFYYNIPIESK